MVQALGWVEEGEGKLISTGHRIEADEGMRAGKR